MGHAASAAGGCSSVGSWLCVGAFSLPPGHTLTLILIIKEGALALERVADHHAFPPAFLLRYEFLEYGSSRRLSTFLPPVRPPWQKWVVAQAQQLCWRLVARCRWPLGHRVFLMHAMRRGAHAGAVRGGPWAPLPFSQFL